ncbi:MAG: helix-turn-helix transcriptional regulator [Oscillospiraceae bacterium]|nr:helix-turn-helix transcriptional regulator [Oscillospiraceae bacterium]
MKKKQCDIFGERLAALRNKKGLTQSELADNIKIQRVTIAKYETGQRAPSIDHLINFAEYFQVSTDYLLGLTETATTDTNVQMVCASTGLSENAVKSLIDLKTDTEDGKRTKIYNNLKTNPELQNRMAIVNDFLSSPYFHTLIDNLFKIKISNECFTTKMNSFEKNTIDLEKLFSDYGNRNVYRAYSAIITAFENTFEYEKFVTELYNEINDQWAYRAEKCIGEYLITMREETIKEIIKFNKTHKKESTSDLVIIGLTGSSIETNKEDENGKHNPKKE